MTPSEGDRAAGVDDPACLDDRRLPDVWTDRSVAGARTLAALCQLDRHGHGAPLPRRGTAAGGRHGGSAQGDVGMNDPIYQQTVADQGFDPARDVREPWSLKAAMRRIQGAQES